MNGNAVLLDSLSSPMRALVLALIAAEKAAVARKEAAPDVETGTASGGGSRDANPSGA